MYPGTHARTSPDKPAIIVPAFGDAPEVTVSYAQLDERSLRLARVLREAGLGKGDHIAFLSDNRPEVFEVYWAALRSGMDVTGINQHLAADEVAWVSAGVGHRGEGLLHGLLDAVGQVGGGLTGFRTYRG